MSLIAKTGPVRPDAEGRCLLQLPIYGPIAPHQGAPIFIWISETKGGLGLAMRGEIEAVGDGDPLPLLVRVFPERPIRPLGKSDLAAAAGEDSALGELSAKLYRHSLHKLADLSTEATELLAGRFAGPPREVENSRAAEHQRWWAPVLEAVAGTSEGVPKLYWPHNVRLALPWRDTWITAYTAEGPQGKLGVFLSGSPEALNAFWRSARTHLPTIQSQVPTGSSATQKRERFILENVRSRGEFADEDAQRRWLAETVIAYERALSALMEDLSAQG